MLTVGLAEKVDAAPRPARSPDVRFTRDQIQELRYAALLHDFGKVGGPGEGPAARGRSSTPARRSRSGSASPTSSSASRPSTCGPGSRRSTPGAPAPDDARGDRRRVPAAARRGGARARRRCCSANEPTVRGGGELPRAHEPALAPLRDFEAEDASRWRHWAEAPYLSAEEVDGPLDPQGQPLRRRSGRRSRATSRTPTSSCRRSPGRASCGAIPEIAWAHHEKLDGSGYPRRLTAPRHPGPVADDDHRRHLRRAGRLGPALQEGGLGRAGAGHPRSTRRGTGSSTRTSSSVFLEAKIYRAARLPGAAQAEGLA